MAYIYILFSENRSKFYTGSCLNLSERLEQHRSRSFSDSFTSKAEDWILFFSISGLEYRQARRIERHIKKMKSSKYIVNLKRFDELSEKLVLKYTDKSQSGESR